ncbi:MAG: hypothetical protein K1X29_09810 [Bdellovibrionales bacterium]|nr:hypothetical protein [Bdellovibrionales bacterium]
MKLSSKLTKMVLLCFMVVFVSPSGLSAQQAINETKNTQTPSSSQSPKISAPGESGQGINEGASQGKAAQMIGMGMNLAMGAMFFSECSQQQYYMCVLGALSMAQAALMGGAAGKSGKVHQASLAGIGTQGIDTLNPNGTNFDTSLLNNPNLTPEQKAAYQGLKDKGFKINADGSVFSPDGKLYTAKDFSSADAMAAAGVPSGSIAGLQAAIQKANQDAEGKLKDLDEGANVVAMAVDGGGGGGGSRSPSNYEQSSLDDYLNKLRNPFGMTAQQKADLASGKSVAHGNDVIGVKVDDIFTMIHRRYQEKRISKEFLEESVASANYGLGVQKMNFKSTKGR